MTLCSAGNVIGMNTGVYLGGLPENFVILRQDTDRRLQVNDWFYRLMTDCRLMIDWLLGLSVALVI